MCLGCPVRQEIVSSSTAIAYGDGLAKAVEGQEAMFYVDSRGQRGDLAVQVDGLYIRISVGFIIIYWPNILIFIAPSLHTDVCYILCYSM